MVAQGMATQGKARVAPAASLTESQDNARAVTQGKAPPVYSRPPGVYAIRIRQPIRSNEKTFDSVLELVY
jgi:hypothetical protein